MPRLLLFTAIAATAFVACESPFEPRGEGERVPIGEEITDDVNGNTGGRYSFVAQSGRAYAVFLEAFEGAVALYVTDSIQGFVVASQGAAPGSRPLYENATATFVAAQGTVYQLRFLPLGSEPLARFRFIVYAVNTSPELQPGVFAFGDTVAGETIDPIVDLDAFTVHGQAGQEVVAVVEIPGPPGNGAVSLTVTDPVTSYPLGFVIADPGLSTSLTTGRLLLPATRDYRFIVASMTSGQSPRYRGPYRFWSYLINRAPEHRSASIPFDTAIAGEHIDHAGDVDEFTFQATAGANFNLFVQAPWRPVRLEVAAPTGAAFAAAVGQGSDTALFTNATGRFQINQAGTYVVRASGDHPTETADTGAYRFFLYAIDPRPEHVPAAIVPGDTISGENIHLPGDVDEFTFNGTAGEEFNTFFQALNGSAATVLTAEVLRPNGAVLATTASHGSDASLHTQATGRFSLPATGTYRIRVTSALSTIARDTGGYRLQLYAVNPQPESSPQALTLGDSVEGERIDLPGDYDRFTLAVPSGTLANIVIWRDDSTTLDGVTLSLTDAGGAAECFVSVYSNNVGGNGSGCGTFAIGSGAHVITVQPTSTSGTGYRGAYRLRTHAISDLAEIAPDSLDVGDTVSGDAIDPLGDRDSFYFRGRKADHVDVLFQAMGNPDPTYGLWLSVLDSTGHGLGSSGSRMGGASLDEFRKGRIDLPVDGRYRIQVTGVNGGRLVVEQGPYRFAVHPVSTAIETANPNLVAGDSVLTERIDLPGDVDRFTLTGPAGQELVIQFHAFPETSPLVLAVIDTMARDTLTTQLSAGFLQSSGRFVLPAAGVAWVRVLEPRFCDTFGGCGLSSYSKVGPYSLKVVTINRAPEVVAATVTIGDTVSGEAIDPVGDVDEFTATGAQGQHLIAYFQTPQGSGYPGLVLQVVDTSGVVLGTVASLNPTPNLEDQSTGSIDLPYSGAYTIRVQGATDRYGNGSYRFKVVLQ